MRETVKKRKAGMAMISDARECRGLPGASARVPVLQCKTTLFADGFTNKSRNRIVQVI